MSTWLFPPIIFLFCISISCLSCICVRFHVAYHFNHSHKLCESCRDSFRLSPPAKSRKKLYKFYRLSGLVIVLFDFPYLFFSLCFLKFKFRRKIKKSQQNKNVCTQMNMKFKYETNKLNHCNSKNFNTQMTLHSIVYEVACTQLTHWK